MVTSWTIAVGIEREKHLLRYLAIFLTWLRMVPVLVQRRRQNYLQLYQDKSLIRAE